MLHGYKVYAAEVLRELRKSRDADIVKKFVDELYKLERIENSKVHYHTILIFKHPNYKWNQKILTYYDEAWNCQLLPNMKTVQNEKKDDFIKRIVSSVGFGSPEYFDVKYLCRLKSNKYSESHREYRTYQHEYFEVIPNRSLINIVGNGVFYLNDTLYDWFSVEEMKKSEKIMKCNRDVVQTLEKFTMLGMI